MQGRLRIGWGTTRVGCGMAIGAKIYHICADSSTRNSHDEMILTRHSTGGIMSTHEKVDRWKYMMV